MSLPLVSIVITNYNRENTISKAIESALEQDYKNLEIIISDNCSTDGSHQIISKYISDSRVKYFRNETNIGMLPNFKICFEERAKGDFITIVNSDDELINPCFISQCIGLILKYENVVLVKSNHIVNHLGRDKNMEYKSYKEFYNGIDFLKEMNFDLDFGWAGILMNTTLINKQKVFDKQINAADYIANFNLLLEGNICFNLTNSYKYFLHNSNASLTSYSIQQTTRLLNELNIFFIELKKKTIEKNAEIIEEKIKTFYISSIYQLNYLENRKEIKFITKILSDFDVYIFNNYQKMLTTKKFKILFYFPKIGSFLTKTKKKIFD